MEKNPSTNRVYNDKLCFFRCLAYHKIKKKKCALLTKRLHKQWLQFAKTFNLKTSNVTLDQIPDLEHCFQVNINVFSLQRDKTVKSVYKSREQFKKLNKPDTMNLNIFENHLSYVPCLRTYAKKVECLMCGRLFPKLHKLNIHSKICYKISKLKFPGGFHHRRKPYSES